MESLTLPAKRSLLTSLLRPVNTFLSAESAGGIVLMVAAVAALVWANSPWGDSYEHLWHMKMFVGVGSYSYSMSLEHWVNEGLMVVFFLLVGLEIKRELLLGELASVRQAALPVAAAIGGMLVPALLYFAINARGPGKMGWGVPMATDIAFAVGVLALVGRGVPTSLKVFLLAIAIVDDLGAVLVIALFYTSKVSGVALVVAGVFFVGLIFLNLLRVHRPLPYVVLGIGLWVAMLFSGIHATVAGVLLALTIPATRRIEEQPYVDYVRKLLACFELEAKVVPEKITDDQGAVLEAMEEASQAVQTPLARVEHALLMPVNFFIIPIFALANAGVDLRGGISSAVDSPVTWGVVVGLVIGKPVGILIASWLAIKSGVAALPAGGTMRQVVGIAVLCGIGFTMSLFIANLAFPGDEGHLTAAKAGIVAASVVSGIVGAIIIVWAGRPAGGTQRGG